MSGLHCNCSPLHIILAHCSASFRSPGWVVGGGWTKKNYASEEEHGFVGGREGDSRWEWINKPRKPTATAADGVGSCTWKVNNRRLDKTMCIYLPNCCFYDRRFARPLFSALCLLKRYAHHLPGADTVDQFNQIKNMKNLLLFNCERPLHKFLLLLALSC